MSTNEVNRFSKESQPNAIIIHGCPDDAEQAMSPESRTFDRHWMPWIAAQLRTRGFTVQAPHMPNPWAPNYESFKEKLEEFPINEKSILIGHSCGCAFLVRWLGETKMKAAKLILVAPWKIPPADDAGRQAFYNYPIDQGIQQRVGEIVMFTSDNEESEGKDSLELFHQALSGQTIELKGRGHYTRGDMGQEAFPELLEVILR